MRRRIGFDPALGWLLRLAFGYRKKFFLAILLGSATIVSNIGLMATSAYLIAKAALGPSIAELQVAIVGVRFFGIARGGLRYLERLVSHDTNLRLLAGIRVWFYSKLEPLAPARLMQYRSGDLLGRVTSDIEILENFFVRVLAPPLIALVIGMLTAAWFFGYSPSLGILITSAFLLVGFFLSFVSRQLGKKAGKTLVKTRSALTALLVDGIQGMQEWLAYGKESRFLDGLAKTGQTLFKQEGRMALITGWQSAMAGLVMDCAVLLVLIIGIPLVRSFVLDGVYLPVLVLGVISSFEAVLPLPVAFQYFESSISAGRRLYEIVDARLAVVDPPIPGVIPKFKHLDCCIEHLSFAYGPGEPLVLDDVSLMIPSGGRMALVGPSGAGKTTLVNLLMRFWDYQSGSIRLGGIDLREMDQNAVRGFIGLVPQRPHLFNATIFDNLLLARPDATSEQVVKAASIAGASRFIEALPDSYGTWIGEQGQLLSGGERQRLAIARAILSDPKLLIMDEPAANLDAITELELMSNLEKVMAGRSTLIITHRLVGLEKVDEIIFLQKGRIIERGKHDELINQGGAYYRMWKQQNLSLGLEMYAKVWYK